MLSGPTPTPVSIYSMVTSVPQVPPLPSPRPTITNCNANFPNPGIISYPFRQDPYTSLTAKQEALVKPTMSAQAPISNPIFAVTPPYKVKLDPIDIAYLKKKSEE